MDLDRYLESFASCFDAYVEGAVDQDFEWFACDADGRLAVFSTAQQLDVPAQVLADRAAYLVIVATIVHLPEVGQSTPRQLGAMFDFGARGLYGFDCASPPVADTYEKEFSPTRELRLQELPKAFRAAIGPLTLQGPRFDQVSAICVR